MNTENDQPTATDSTDASEPVVLAPCAFCQHRKLASPLIGFNSRRLVPNNITEVKFANEWEAWHSHGKDTLNQIIPTVDLTDRDRKIAATVIQWLGSSVGSYFIQAARKNGS